MHASLSVYGVILSVSLSICRTCLRICMTEYYNIMSDCIRVHFYTVMMTIGIDTSMCRSEPCSMCITKSPERKKRGEKPGRFVTLPTAKPKNVWTPAYGKQGSKLNLTLAPGKVGEIKKNEVG